MFSDSRTRLPAGAKRAVGIKRSAPGAILGRIRASLEKEPRINLHRFPITLSFDDDDLVLSGEVENIAAKKIALELAATHAPTGRIVDRLHLVPAGPMSDREIRDHVVKVLLEEPALERCLVRSGMPDSLETHRQATSEPTGTILIEVSAGVVTLNGEVPSLSHKRLAGAIAWWVPGCRDVINGLAEAPAQEDNDDELNDAVRLVLEKDPLINASKIRVTTKDSIVTLEGLVPNETMKQIAERDGWYVLGVREVVNRLQVKW
jgi:osmotically-inducible protein OsmY